MTAIYRMSCDERFRAYVESQIKEGKTRKETIRCLKGYVARKIYGILVPYPYIQEPDLGASANIEASLVKAYTRS